MDFHHLIAISIDHPGAGDFGDPFSRVPKPAMDMAVNEIAGVVAFEQAAVGFEAAMAEVVGVVNAARWGVGEHDIDTAPPPQGRFQFPQQLLHLPFGILHRTPIVPHGTLEPQKVQPLEADQAPVQIDAAPRRLALVADVVVAADEKQRRSQLRLEKREIFRRQITAGKNQIEPREAPAIEVFGEIRHHRIGNGQNAHGEAALAAYP